MAETAVTQTGAAGRYNAMAGPRWSYLARARAASKLTIPSLIPPEGTTGNSTLPTPWQSIGARGVNNLSARLLLSLFPPNSPFFRLTMGDIAKDKLTGNPDMKAEVESALAKVENEVQAEVESSMIRPAVSEGLKHLIVGGNVLLYLQPDDGIRTYHLGNYVVKRAPSGNVMEILTYEKVSPMELPEETQAAIKAAPKDTPAAPANGAAPVTVKSADDTVELYTWIKRTPRNWTVHQEVRGMIIPGTQGNYPTDKCPWLALRWSRVDGEDYGRGFVEEYQGDLQTVEGLSQSIVEGAAASAKILILVNPNGVTKLKDVAEAPNGAVRAGVATDVTVVQVSKHADLGVASNTIKEISERLSWAFMLNSAVQRNAERVTAEEIRFMAQELDASQGGLYSILSQELQLPLVKRLMFQMERKKKLPALPPDMVKPTIVTGLEALGRGNDLNRLSQFIQAVAQVDPQFKILPQYLNISDYLTRVATATGINTEGLIKTQDQVTQEQQQAQKQAALAAAAQAAVPHAAKAMGDIATHNAIGAAAPAAPSPAQ